MKIVAPKPFTFKAGKRAVLLLHGFTGNTADVRMLGRFLQEKGYTSHAPLYQGHGVPPEKLLETDPEDWWQDVVDSYNLLKNEGHEEIAVVGLSLGGVFSLKIGYTFPIKGIVPMCAPMTVKTQDKLHRGLQKYALEYKQLEKKSPEQIAEEMKVFEQKPKKTFNGLKTLYKEVRGQIDMIYAPTFVVQARHDEMIDSESAEIIHENIESDKKSLKWYEKANHVITLSEEKEQLHEDIFQFLERLDWSS